TATQTQRLPTSQGSTLSSALKQTDSDGPSTPIRIQQPTTSLGDDKSNGTPSRRVKAHDTNESEHEASPSASSDSDDGMGFDDFGSLASSIPKSTIPFVRNVNASNPLKGNPNREAFFGRWQHLYPRKPRASTVKWRSLCTPASVPLTTEDFPSRDVLQNEFDFTSYTISLDGATEQLENPEAIADILAITAIMVQDLSGK
ncbi:MAG: vacuolar membrane-associated protein iml1, partial [Watsoniomyces obsoletus]